MPFDASKATQGGRVSVEKLNRGGLPLVLSQTFRAIIHSRMKVGMEKYDRQYPHADIVLFEPDREDADIMLRQTTRDLKHTLDQLQRWLAGAR